MHENELRNRIWELTVENERLKRCYEEDRRTIARLIEYTQIKDEELISAKASGKAVIEKAARIVEQLGTKDDYYSPHDVAWHIRNSLNSDATAALNEMLADVWDKGYTSGYHGRGRHTNPYQKEKK